jgi:hypothetical protein
VKASAIPDRELHDHAARVFVPNACLPVQYFDSIRRRKMLTGERRLMLAVLEQAADDYLKHYAVDLRHRRLFAEAVRWIESADRSHLYCFANICDHLGLDAEYLRRGLRRRGLRDSPDANGSMRADDSAVRTRRAAGARRSWPLPGRQSARDMAKCLPA